MFLTQLFENSNRRVVVIYAGRFQPFHRGHAQVYNHLCKTYGYDNVYIVTSNKVEAPKSPFDFSDKLKMITLTGVDPSRVVQSSQPYIAKEVTANYNPETDIVIFAVSEKDMAEDPRFAFKPKKDGSPSYFQPLQDINQCEPLGKHGYITTVPTFTFTVLGKPANSASQIRAMFTGADEQTQKNIVKDLFGKYDEEVFTIMQSKLGQPAVTETEELTELKVAPGATKQDRYGQWDLRYELRPVAGSKVFRGMAKHSKSLKTPPVKVDGVSVEDVKAKLIAAIDGAKSTKEISPNQFVTIDFNVLLTRDIIGHDNAMYGDIIDDNGVPTMLVSDKKFPGSTLAVDRRAIVNRRENTTGQHAFRMSGKKAIAAGLTHARYTLGEPFQLDDTVTAFPLKFSSEVHPGESFRLSEPGIVVAYPRNTTNEAKDDGRAKIISYKDRNGITKYEVLNADGVRVKGDMSKELAQEYLRAHRSELQESVTPDKKIAALQKKYDTLKGRCDMARDRRRMKGQRLLSQAEMKYMRQMSDINQQIHLLKAESMKPNTVTESIVSSTDLANIIADRIEYRYPDLYTRYGLEVVGDAIQDIAEFHAGDLEELGTSDIGGMVREVIRRLEIGADLGESAVKYTARETKDGTWRVFKQGESVSVAGPFDSADEASQWIKDHGSVNEGWKSKAAAVATAASLAASPASGIVVNALRPIDSRGNTVADPYKNPAPKPPTKKDDKVDAMTGAAPVVKPPKKIKEAKSLNKHVKIVAGPAKGKTGWVGEVRHGAFKGAPKEYTIDLEGGGNVRCSANELRLIKGEQVNESSIQTWKKQAIKDHGDGLVFVKDKHGDGLVNRVFAKKDGKTVATYDRNRNAGTVFAPVNESAINEAANNQVIAADNVNTNDVFQALIEVMSDIAEDFSQYTVPDSSVPSAPDSSKFRATRGGMISFEKNVHVHGGYYGQPRTYRLFIKIGGAVDPKVCAEIKSELDDAMRWIVGVPFGPTVYFEDGHVMYTGEVNGTNWGGYGVWFEKAEINDNLRAHVKKVNESSDYARRRQREEDIISGKKPARKKAPAQTSDYAKRRAKEKANESSLFWKYDFIKDPVTKFKLIEQELCGSESLLESNSSHTREYFDGLDSNEPIIGKTYFVLILALVNDRLTMLDSIGLVGKLLETDGQFYKIALEDGRTTEVPQRREAPAMLTKSFLFNDANVYSKFSTAVKLNWGIQLPQMPELPVTEAIKIGMRAINEGVQNKAANKLIESMMAGARNGDMKVVAEHIEKLEAYLDCGVIEHIEKAIKVAKRNAG